MRDRLRIAFAIAWIAGQIALIGTAGQRADGAFGFRMFPESTTITIHLVRDLGSAGTADVEAEEWIAKDPRGAPQRVSWDGRVVDPVLSHLDVTMHASYGRAAQLERLQAALDDVARSTIDDDFDTCFLEAHVTTRRNGRDPEEIVLRSQKRPCRGAP